jgi:hypothetical protein
MKRESRERECVKRERRRERKEQREGEEEKEAKGEGKLSFFTLCLSVSDIGDVHVTLRFLISMSRHNSAAGRIWPS